MATNRLTTMQRNVLRHLWNEPDLTLEQAAVREQITYAILRKWMADREFHDCWEDCRRWRRARIRENLEQAMLVTADALRKQTTEAPSRDIARLTELAERLLGQAQLLGSAEREEQVAPVRQFGWCENRGSSGRDINPVPSDATPGVFPTAPNASDAAPNTSEAAPSMFPTAPSAPAWPGLGGQTPASSVRQPPPPPAPKPPRRTLTQEEFNAIVAMTKDE